MAETTTAGAMPAAAGATPAQTPPAAPETVPATGTDEALGDGGKQALQQERDARKTAERELKKLTDKIAALELAGKSEQEQAVAKARSEGETEGLTKAQKMVRRASVDAALAAAGCTDPAIAARADEFSELAVDEDGNVEGLGKAVTAFKAAHPTLFANIGSFDQGARSNGSAALPIFRASQLNDRAFWEANKVAIMLAQRDGRIVNDNP